MRNFETFDTMEDKTKKIDIPKGLCDEEENPSSDNDSQIGQYSISLEENCLSPPALTRQIQKSNKKYKDNKKSTTQHTNLNKYTTKPKRPHLVNSAENIDPGDLDIADSLQTMQDEYEKNMKKNPLSAPVMSNETLPWRIQPTENFDRDTKKTEIQNLLNSVLRIKPHSLPPLTPVQPLILTSQFASLSQRNYSSNTQVDIELRKYLNDKIWKEMFDYFVYYDNRAENDEELEERISRRRSEIPQKIRNIMKLNYTNIKNDMDFHIKENMKTFLDYSKLYDNKVYIDQLCYLNLLIEDNLNNISYIETLYPSIEKLRQNQKDYSNEFDSTAKTLLLWHKIVKDLMEKSDQLGKFLGFEKHQEYLDYWNWFVQRSKYIRQEYEKIHEWLNKNLTSNQSSSTIVDSSDRSEIQSPIILLTNPTLSDFKIDGMPLENNVLNQRQISYLLKSFEKNDIETIRSSMSVNMQSETDTPESIDHLFSAKIEHISSFFINNQPSQTLTDQILNNQPVNFDLDYAEEEDREVKSENVDSVIETDIKNTINSYIHHTDSALNLSNENRRKIFRDFLRKRLRKFGLTKTFDKIREILLSSLSHALLALQIDKCERSALADLNDYHLIPLHHKCRELIQNFYQDQESIKYGVHSDKFIQLGLPSFRPLFIYLNNVILDLMHLCIEMQNENKGDIKFDETDTNPDLKLNLLSIEVMTKECRECIEQAILVRQFYYHMIYSVFDHEEINVQEHLDKDLFKFDEDLDKTINIYLTFITNWVHNLLKNSDFPKALWVLENEWKFCKNNLYFVMSSEDIYASRFCKISGSVFSSLIHMFDTKYKEPLREQIESVGWDKDVLSAGVDLYDSLSLSLSLTINQSKEEEEEEEGEGEGEEEDEDEEETYSEKEILSKNDSLNLKFIDFKEEINKLRKYCLRTLDFIGEFLADLELAAKYQVEKSIQEVLDKLMFTNHVKVNFTNQILPDDGASFLIFVPQEFAKDKIQIVRLLFIISEKDDFESHKEQDREQDREQEKMEQGPGDPKNLVRRLSSSNSIFNPYSQDHKDLKKLSDFVNKLGPVISGRSSPINPPANQFHNTFVISPSHNSDGYLLYLQLSNMKHEYKWNGQTIDLHASHSVRKPLYQHTKRTVNADFSYLYLVTSKQSILNNKKIDLERKMQGTITLIKEKASFHPSIDDSIAELKEEIFILRTECVKLIKSIETDLKVPHNFDPKTSNEMLKIERNVNEILRVSYIFGIELLSEITKFLTQDRAEGFVKGLAEFSVQWCEYIVNKTARGKGRTSRPWAANKGLQLIQVVISFSKFLDTWDFKKLSQSVERCFAHLKGDKESDNLLKPLNQKLNISQTSLNNFAKVSNKCLPPQKRFEKECLNADKIRETARYIGRILDVNRQDSIINGTEVQFRWQLGLLIGEGSFGKVYSCVNLDTYEPMALKIIEFKNKADAETVKQIAKEINNVVDIDHENLVKVYGSELHRKEILIFMEFCGDQCTLDRLSRDASGLPEKLVRNYTKSLLKAVDHLHEKNIIHRDVKGANIFLKSTDYKHPEKVVLKLGDFGCSIRLKDPIGSGTRDQATGLMGTYAFMAPEVMAAGSIKEGGYTYSADIWSVGCVVIEMFTGKRPWHPFKDEAILFKVHLASDNQKKPPYPSPISNEAEDFLNCCFEFDPKLRKGADQLLEHRFVKVTDDD